MTKQQIIEILNVWLDYCKFDPNKSSFNLASVEYDMHKLNKKIVNIINNFDNNGFLSLIYAKHNIKDLLKTIDINLFDIINNKKTFDVELNIWSKLNQPEIIDAENNFVKSMLNIINGIIKTPLIGEPDLNNTKQQMIVGIDTVLENISELQTDVYIKGSQIKSIENFNTHIHVFNTLAECLMGIEHTHDGMYLCYISNYNSSDGYFGFFVKSNGNIFSINERINEAFAGQHKNMRNNRWAESKCYDLFPYDYIFTFDKHDYKGYASKHIINKDMLDFINLKQDQTFNIVLAMMIISNKYTDITFSNDVNISYVDSLCPVNVETVCLEKDVDDNSIVKYNNSAIVTQHKNIQLNFDVDKILSGFYDKQFDKSNDQKKPNETGWFIGYNQIMIDTHGHDFSYDPNSVMLTDYSTKLIGNNVDSDDYVYNSEFVGSKERLQLQGYYNIRTQLAKHIKNNQLKSFNEFGGVTQLDKWWTKQLEKNIHHIYKMCVDKDKSIQVNPNIIEQIVEDLKHYPRGVYVKKYLNKYSPIGTKIECRITRSSCSIFFVFRPNNWNDLQKLINCDVPDFIKGWYKDRNYPMCGNHLLNAVDPVSRITTPVNRYFDDPSNDLHNSNDSYYSFDFVIGFSKNGFKRICKGI